MKILFLDTSSFFVTISIVENNNIKFFYHEEIRDDMSSKIMPIISTAFKDVGFKVNDIDKIMVCTGPGSFTGVRIGVTIAKVLAWSLKKDIIGISSLEFYATSNFDTEYIIPMIDARRGYVYAGVYDKHLNIIKQDSYVEYSSFSNYFSQSTIVSFDKLNDSVVPNINVLKIIDKHLHDTPMNCHNINPNYLKRTEAEENLMRKNND